MTKENCIKCITVSPKLATVIICPTLLIRGVIQHCVYETKINDIDDLRKRLMQTWFDFDQNITDAAVDQWCDHLKSRVHAGGGHFEHMFIYMIHQNVLSNCQFNLMYVTAIL